MLIVNQDKTNAYNIDCVRSIYVTGRGEIKVAADFGRGGVIGKYANAEEAQKAFGLIMFDIDTGREIVQAPEQERARNTKPKNRQHFASDSAQNGHGES